MDAGGEGDPALPPPCPHGAPGGTEALQAHRDLHRAQGHHDRTLCVVCIHAGVCVSCAGVCVCV